MEQNKSDKNNITHDPTDKPSEKDFSKDSISVECKSTYALIDTLGNETESGEENTCSDSDADSEDSTLPLEDCPSDSSVSDIKSPPRSSETSGLTVNERPIEDEKPPKPKKKKVWLNLLFITINVLAIIFIAFIEFYGNEEDGTLKTTLQNIGDRWYFLLIALGCFLLTYVFEGLKYLVMIHAFTKRWRPIVAINTAILGKYYDYITPLASGGQPFQIYYLRKKKIPIGLASAIPVASLFMQHIAFALLSLTVYIFNGSVVDSTVIKVLAYCGSIFAFLVPFAIIVFSLIPKFASAVARFVVKLLHKLKIVKDYDKAINNTIKSIEDYRSSLRYIGKSKGSLVLSFFCSLFYRISLFSIPFFVVLACGGSSPTFMGYINMTSLCVFVYASVAMMPTPGTSGAAEVSFYAIFQNVAAVSTFWMMLIWRFFSFYMYLIVGIALIIYQSAAKVISKRKK